MSVKDLFRYKTCNCLFCDHWILPGGSEFGVASPTSITIQNGKVVAPTETNRPPISSEQEGTE